MSVLYASLVEIISTREKFVVHDRSSCGEKYQDHCLEMYEICIEIADNISDRIWERLEKLTEAA